jgi:hypothetical protein
VNNSAKRLQNSADRSVLAEQRAAGAGWLAGLAVGVSQSAIASRPTAAMFGARSSLIDGQGAPIVLVLVEGFDGCAGPVVIVHFDKAESSTTAGVAVLDDLGTVDLAELPEQLSQVVVCDIVA